MKRKRIFMLLYSLPFGFGLITSIHAQEMTVVRVAEFRLAGDKGSSEGVYQNQYYTIYRMTARGRRPIGEAQVFVVKDNVCGLNILSNDNNYPVQTGDILVAADAPAYREEAPPAAVVTESPPPETGRSGKGRIGLRGGIGTDITGGIVYGGSLNYLFPVSPSPFEVGLVIFGGSFEETTEEEINTYTETTDILVYGLLGNYLINYHRISEGFFFLVGSGFGLIDVSWEERSSGDTSLGTPLPGGGSKQSEEASAFGLILNIGAGHKWRSGTDIRFEIPVFIITDAPGDASSVAPAFTLTAGIRFD